MAAGTARIIAANKDEAEGNKDNKEMIKQSANSAVSNTASGGGSHTHSLGPAKFKSPTKYKTNNMASPNKNMKTGDYSQDFEKGTGYTPYKMTGHELPGIKQRSGAKMKAFGVNDSDMPDKVSQKSGALYAEGGVGSSPAKNIFKKLKNALGGGADPAAQIKMKMEQMKAAVAAAKAGGAGAAGAAGGGVAAVGGGGEVPQHGAESHSGESVNPAKQQKMMAQAAGGTSGGGGGGKFGRMSSQSGITAAGAPGSGQGPEMAEEEMV